MDKYCPSTSEMMYIYRSTSGVSESSVKGEACFRLVEMGGRSLTTPKLLYFFDNANAAIFVASCCDVERKFRNGVFTSGFMETCEFFSLVARDPTLVKVPIILIITKLDLLMEKAKRVDLKTVLSDFKGDPREVKDVKKNLLEAFRTRCHSRPLYHHFLTCTEITNVREVFAEIKRDLRDSLLRKLLPQPCLDPQLVEEGTCLENMFWSLISLSTVTGQDQDRRLFHL
ncbi:guanine nucleotide-binding protein subunit alpha-12-like [Littorina saxatilis]|uniref:guanine nucleotide-binding protein subunit alpha-12-like n=1 Tax=Littorina saxatilis TaxID=31220 RepID=UPI0038B41982